MSDLKYFLLSLLFHIMLITGILGFFIISNKYTRNYIIKSSDGALLSVNIVNDGVCKKKPEIEKKTTNKKVNKVLNTPKDDNAKININKDEKKTQNSKNMQSTTSTGGSGNETTEVIPVLKEGIYIDCVAPTYPRTSLNLGEEGTVIIRVLLNNQGEIIKKILHKSSGFNRLDNAAMQASNSWKINVVPKNTLWIEVVINFIIR